MPNRLLVRITALMSWMTAGWAPEYRFATRSFPRSTASVYWIRSLVPIEKNETSRAKTAAMRAALGTSIMMPTGISRSKSIPSSSSSSATSWRIIFVWRSSIAVEISGNMIRMGPKAEARRIARSCTRNIGMFWRQ